MEDCIYKSSPYRSPGSRIAVLYRMDRDFFAKKLKEYCLGTSEMAVLLQLSYYRELSQDQISTNIVMDKTTLSKIVKKLLHKGHIYMVRDTQDNRVHLLGLTQKGQEMIPVLKDATAEWVSIISKGFEPEEITLFCNILDRMNVSVEAYEADQVNN